MLYLFGSRIVFAGLNGVGYFFGNLRGGKPFRNLLQRNHLDAKDQRQKKCYDLIWLHQAAKLTFPAAKIGIRN